MSFFTEQIHTWSCRFAVLVFVCVKNVNTDGIKTGTSVYSGREGEGGGMYHPEFTNDFPFGHMPEEVKALASNVERKICCKQQTVLCIYGKNKKHVFTKIRRITFTK